MYRVVWTDERMDDFAAHTDRRFDVVDKRLDSLERRMDSGFERVDQRIDGLHQMMHRTMVQLGAGMIVTLALGFVGVIASH